MLIFRDSHKPIHTDRSVSPSPFQSQPKAPPPKSSYSKTSSTPYSNSSKKQHGTPAAGTASSRKPKPASKPVPGVKSEYGGKNFAAVAAKAGGSGTSSSSSVKVEKRQPKPTKSGSQPKTSGYNLLQPHKPGGTDFGSQESDISPLPSSNPTPEPGAAPPKRPRLSSGSSSSSSSGSSSSGSDSGEETSSHDGQMTSQRPAIPAVPSIPVTSHSDIPKGTTGSHTYLQPKQASINPSSLHPPAQKSDTLRPLSRSSSAGQPHQQMSRLTMLTFVDTTSAQLLNRPSSRHETRSGVDGSQPAKVPTPPLSQQGSRDKPVGPGGGATKVAGSSSSSSSDSDSSSGSSSSESSSDSDGEVDREVVSWTNNYVHPPNY